MTLLTRFAPGPEFGMLRREMDRLFDTIAPSRTDDEMTSAVWAPRADVSETNDAYLVWMDLPGIEAEDIDVTFEDGMLKVSGERHSQREEESGQYHRIERSYGRFFRSFRFGENADPDRIEADFSAGVLTVRLNKRETSKPRRIEVGRAQNGQRHEIETS